MLPERGLVLRQTQKNVAEGVATRAERGNRADPSKSCGMLHAASFQNLACCNTLGFTGYSRTLDRFDDNKVKPSAKGSFFLRAGPVKRARWAIVSSWRGSCPGLPSSHITVRRMAEEA